MIHYKSFHCYWAASGAMGLIASIMSAKQKRAVIHLLEDGATEIVDVEEKISPKQLFLNCPDRMFYSLLVQTGYLSLETWGSGKGSVAIPNIELKEVWRRFLLSNFFQDMPDIENISAWMDSPEEFAASFEQFMEPVLEALSYHDLPKKKYPDGRKRTPEIHYHTLINGVLYAYKKDLGYRSIRSNRESGDGRYDILLEFDDRVIIFEIKSATDSEHLEDAAKMALEQIQAMRYGADSSKPILGVGCAFCGKQCRILATDIIQ
jgi:hypothetical protein